MKSPKRVGIDNPVLHFGSNVAKDIIGEQINGHFKKAFNGLATYEKEIHLGMLKAMRDQRQPSDVRARLVLNKNVPIQKIHGLLRRYVLILDTDWRRNAFLNEEKTFWEASRRTPGAKGSKFRYEDLIYALVVTCEKQDISNEQVCQDFAARRTQYKAEHGWA